MKTHNNDLKKHYIQCIKTPSLWIDNSIKNITQYQLDKTPFVFKTSTPNNLRLGKLVERFICFQLKQDPTVKILIENLQIQNSKHTVGELDCLFIKGQITIHLEIIYKFYLYDNSVETSELEHWVGPNKKDSLIQKLDKLKNKQLPLLSSQHTKPYLDKLDIKSTNIKQHVCFKAQLFTPYYSDNVSFTNVNPECVKGFYINEKQISNFNDCKFYIPKKLDWLLEPHPNVLWEKFDTINDSINALLKAKKSPMVWIQKPNEELLKCFITWWS